jgi:hypothetical protein
MKDFVYIWRRSTRKRKIAMVIALALGGWFVVPFVLFVWWFMDKFCQGLDRFDRWLDTE